MLDVYAMLLAQASTCGCCIQQSNKWGRFNSIPRCRGFLYLVAASNKWGFSFQFLDVEVSLLHPTNGDT